MNFPRPVRDLLPCVLIWGAIGSIAAAEMRFVSARPLTSWESIGLTTAWIGQTAADGVHGRVGTVAPYLTGIAPRTIYELQGGSLPETFAPGTLDRRGILWGDAEAKRQADIALRTLLARGIKGKVVTKQIPRFLLYCQTDSGVVQSLDGETGAILWTSAQGYPFQPAEGIAANERYLASIRGSTLYVIDLENHTIVTEKPLQGIPSGPPALTDDHVLVPLLRGRMAIVGFESSHLDSRSPSFRGTLLAPPLRGEGRIAWLTDASLLYLADPATFNVDHRVEMRSQVSPAMARHKEGILYVTTDDGFVHAVRESTGEIAWQRMVGGYIVQAPFVIEDQLAVIAQDGTLHSFQAKTGEPQWVVGGIRVVASGGTERLNCLTLDGRLVALARDTGRSVGSIAIAPWTLLFSNAVSDRTYLTTSTGSIRCLRPSDKPWPTYFIDPPKPASEPLSPKVDDRPPAPSAGESEESPLEVPAEEAAPAEPEAAPEEEAEAFGSESGGSDDNPFE